MPPPGWKTTVIGHCTRHRTIPQVYSQPSAKTPLKKFTLQFTRDSACCSNPSQGALVASGCSRTTRISRSRQPGGWTPGGRCSWKSKFGTTRSSGDFFWLVSGLKKKGPPELCWAYLEDHPRTRMWLISMVSKSPKWGYSPSKWPKWLMNGGY